MVALGSGVENRGLGTVGIVGGGSIGVAFAIVFARAGWTVKLYDPDDARREQIVPEFRMRLEALAKHGLIDGAIEGTIRRLSIETTLESAVNAADLVIECAPERVEVKREIFARLDASAPPDAILASASSAIPVSSYTGDLVGRSRCLVAHPGNPPYLISVVELVPAPFTAADAVERAQSFFAAAGMRPVTVNKEVEGFVFNRLQGALLREAYCLVRDGVASVDDIDLVVREGLGLRWSVLGPFETVDLNTRGGIASHAVKMGPAYARMGAERGQHDPWTADLVEQVSDARRAALPIEQWEARVVWRDEQLMRLLGEKKRRAAE